MKRYISVVVLVAVVAAVYVWEQTQAVRLGYRVDALRRECEQREQTNKELRVRVNQLISLERLAQVARDRGLVEPPRDRVIYLND